MASDSSEPSLFKRYHPRHVVHPSNLTLQECLALSDVVISAVPSASYKVTTEWLKDGCVCVNVAADKNFDKDVRDKVTELVEHVFSVLKPLLGVYLYPRCRQSYDSDASKKPV